MGKSIKEPLNGIRSLAGIVSGTVATLGCAAVFASPGIGVWTILGLISYVTGFVGYSFAFELPLLRQDRPAQRFLMHISVAAMILGAIGGVFLWRDWGKFVGGVAIAIVCEADLFMNRPLPVIDQEHRRRESAPAGTIVLPKDHDNNTDSRS